jgi:hypothetical protein
LFHRSRRLRCQALHQLSQPVQLQFHKQMFPRRHRLVRTGFQKTTAIHNSMPTSTPPFHVNQATTPTTPFVSPMDLDVKFNIGSSSTTHSAIKRHSPGSTQSKHGQICQKKI